MASRRIRLRRRRYCITLNNPTVQDCLRWDTVLILGNEAPCSGSLSFLIVQTEKGENGTVHYQAYTEWSKQVDWSVVKKVFGDRIHIEASRGTANANIRYCTKLEGRYTGDDPICLAGKWGKAKRSGGDLMAAIEIVNGAKLKDLVVNYPLFVLKNMQKINSLVSFIKGPRVTLPRMIILTGKTGAGKSRFVLERYGSSAYWVSPPAAGKVWFGGYCGQDVMVFDDFHAGWFTLTHLLRIMDRYPLLVAPKGDQVWLNSETMVFTSNVDPKDWYSGYNGLPEHKQALERRISKYCEIFDCSDGGLRYGPFGLAYPYMKKVLRVAEFKFDTYNFSLGGSHTTIRGPIQNYGL